MKAKSIGSVFALSSLILAMSTVMAAKESGHPGTPESDMRYEGAPLATSPGEAKDLVTDAGPPMTKAEFDQWLAFAQQTAWPEYAKTVEGGQEYLDLALDAMK